jgi:hypothetical protein
MFNFFFYDNNLRTKKVYIYIDVFFKQLKLAHTQFGMIKCPIDHHQPRSMQLLLCSVQQRATIHFEKLSKPK